MKSAQLSEIITRLSRIESRLNEMQGRSEDGMTYAPLTVSEFATEIGRSAKYPDFVYDEIREGRIIPLPGKRPILIPRSELVRYRTVRPPR